MSYQFDRSGFIRVKDYSAKVEQGEVYPEKAAVACLPEKDAKLPVRAHATDAGADLFARGNEFGADNTITIQPGEQRMLDTGVAMKIPVGYAGFVEVRSSQRKQKITSWGSGIIDSAYRGTVRVILSNQSDKPYTFKDTEAIAQLVIKRVELVDFVDIWNDTERGTGGFGSTNKQ